jgi:hypothetical protein
MRIVKKYEVFDKRKEMRKERPQDAITRLFDSSAFGETKIGGWDEETIVEREVDMNEFGLKEKPMK